MPEENFTEQSVPIDAKEVFLVENLLLKLIKSAIKSKSKVF